VDVPHDWSTEGEIEEANPSGPRGGFVPAGAGWYRKRLALPADLEGRRVFVDFDGVYRCSDVWVNGVHLGRRPSGYASFRYDLTPHLSVAGPNVLAVRVDNSAQPNSRWYTGSGIYRHVWLTVTRAVHVDHWGTFVTTPDLSSDAAAVCVRTTLVNTDDRERTVTLRTTIVDTDGQAVAETDSSETIGPGQRVDAEHDATVTNPRLWSPEHPDLYTVRSVVVDGDDRLDTYETPLGIRSARFDAAEGFLLNGERVKLRGVNEHHDAGCLGAAAPDAAVRRRLTILQAMGCNAIRTAHNPPSPVLLDLCDRMGLLVMDEAFDEWRKGKTEFGYSRDFDAWSSRDLTDLIRRDRNHPCVVLWSVGNEIPERGSAQGVEILERLLDICHTEEPTRPVTCGCNSIDAANESGFAERLDVVGYNGGGGSVFQYDEDRETYPDRIMLATEVPHTFQTRGVYRTRSWMRVRDTDRRPAPRDVGLPVANLTDEEIFPEFPAKYCSSYDNCSVRISARDSWRLTRDRDWFAGEFRWTGFDYLGETLGWPARCWNFGVIDLCGFPKDTYHFYRSRWTTEPMVHLLPHWTWPGKEGVTIPVWCYTNCERVELLLNGRTLGEQEMGDRMHLSWDVPYEPGELRAIGRRGGDVVAEQAVHTAGPPAGIELQADRTDVSADGRDLVHVTARIVDADGHFMPTASDRVTFTVEGEGKLIGVDNGDPLDRDSYQADSRRAFHGLCLAVIQTTQRLGAIRIHATAKGLSGGTVRAQPARRNVSY